ncbi:DUF732 domain-containing protein [Mycolicibacterium sp. XJ1819]
MRKLAVRTGCATMGAVLTLLTAPVVHADNASFVAQTRALGFVQWDDVLIRMGLSACKFLQPHYRRGPVEVAEHIKRYANVDFDQARHFLILAVTEYCPQYADRVGSL